MTLAATQINQWIAKEQSFDRNLTRPLTYGAFDFFKQQTDAANSIIPENVVKEAFSQMPKEVKIPVIDQDTVVVGSTRTCTITDTANTSKLFKVTFVPFTIAFSMYPEQHTNNMISYEREFGRQMEKHIRALGVKLDQAAITALDTNKTKVYNDALYYTETSDVLKIEWDQRNDILGDLGPMMVANNFSRRVHVIGSAGLNSLTGKLDQKGMYNEENKQLEFNDKVLHFSSQMVKGSGNFLSAFAVEDGNCAMLTQVAQVAIAGRNTANVERGITTLPGLNLQVGFRKAVEEKDCSAIRADMTCDIRETFQFSFTAAFITAYNSDMDKIPNPIMKLEVAQSDFGALAKPVRIVTDNTHPVYTKVAN